MNVFLQEEFSACAVSVAVARLSKKPEQCPFYVWFEVAPVDGDTDQVHSWISAAAPVGHRFDRDGWADDTCTLILGLATALAGRQA